MGEEWVCHLECVGEEPPEKLLETVPGAVGIGLAPEAFSGRLSRKVVQGPEE